MVCTLLGCGKIPVLVKPMVAICFCNENNQENQCQAVVGLCMLKTTYSCFPLCVCGTDLEKGTDYRVRISALTVNGTGPVTGWLHATTYHNDLDGEWTKSLWPGFSVLVLDQVHIMSAGSCCLGNSLQMFGGGGGDDLPFPRP